MPTQISASGLPCQQPSSSISCTNNTHHHSKPTLSPTQPLISSHSNPNPPNPNTFTTSDHDPRTSNTAPSKESHHSQSISNLKPPNDTQTNPSQICTTRNPNPAPIIPLSNNPTLPSSTQPHPALLHLSIKITMTMTK